MNWSCTWGFWFGEGCLRQLQNCLLPGFQNDSHVTWVKGCQGAEAKEVVTSASKPIGFRRSKGSKGLHSFHPKIQQIQRTQMLQMMVTWYKDLLPSCVGEVSFVAICCRQGWSHRWSAHLILLPTKTVVVASLWQRLPWAKEKGTTKQKQDNIIKLSSVWKDLLDGRQVQDNFHKGIGQSIHVHPGLMQVASKDVASKDNCQSWRWRHLTLEALRQQRNRKKRNETHRWFGQEFRSCSHVWLQKGLLSG